MATASALSITPFNGVLDGANPNGISPIELAPALAGFPLTEFAALAYENTKANYPSNPYSYTGAARYGQNSGGETYFFEPFIADWRYRVTPHYEFNSWVVNDSTPVQYDAKLNPISLDDNGGTNISAIVSIAVPGYYGGVYVLEWDRSVCPAMSINFGNAFGATLELTMDDAANGRREYTLTIPPDITEDQFREAFFGVEMSAPITGYNDWHLYMPGHEQICKAGYPFNSVVMEQYATLDVLRCMDILNTNGSPVTTPDTLSDDDFCTWAERGVPYKYMFRIAAQAGIPTLWINIPHEATDATIQLIAQQCYDEFIATHPDERVVELIVEYSNEIWNTAFSQTNYAAGQGAAAYPASEDFYEQMGAWVARRSHFIKQTFQAVFGDHSSIIKLVLCGQLSFSAVNTLRAASPLYPDVTPEIDYFGFGAYFGGDLNQAFADANNIQDWTDQQFLNYSLRQGAEALVVPDPNDPPFDVPGIVTFFQNESQDIEDATDRNDIGFVSYELGQHFDAHTWTDSPNRDAQRLRMREFNQSVEMGQVYQVLFEALINSGISMITGFGGFADVGDSQYWGNQRGQWGLPYHKKLAYEAINGSGL